MKSIADLSVFENIQNQHNRSIGYNRPCFSVKNDVDTAIDYHSPYTTASDLYSSVEKEDLDKPNFYKGFTRRNMIQMYDDQYFPDDMMNGLWEYNAPKQAILTLFNPDATKSEYLSAAKEIDDYTKAVQWYTKTAVGTDARNKYQNPEQALKFDAGYEPEEEVVIRQPKQQNSKLFGAIQSLPESTAQSLYTGLSQFITNPGKSKGVEITSSGDVVPSSGAVKDSSSVFVPLSELRSDWKNIVKFIGTNFDTHISVDARKFLKGLSVTAKEKAQTALMAQALKPKATVGVVITENGDVKATNQMKQPANGVLIDYCAFLNDLEAIYDIVTPSKKEQIKDREAREKAQVDEAVGSNPRISTKDKTVVEVLGTLKEIYDELSQTDSEPRGKGNNTYETDPLSDKRQLYELADRLGKDRLKEYIRADGDFSRMPSEVYAEFEAVMSATDRDGELESNKQYVRGLMSTKPVKDAMDKINKYMTKLRGPAKDGSWIPELISREKQEYRGGRQGYDIHEVDDPDSLIAEQQPGRTEVDAFVLMANKFGTVPSHESAREAAVNAKKNGIVDEYASGWASLWDMIKTRFPDNYMQVLKANGVNTNFVSYSEWAESEDIDTNF